eukprot:13120071-Alexandrium_andersonii.AAC.1
MDGAERMPAGPLRARVFLFAARPCAHPSGARATRAVYSAQVFTQMPTLPMKRAGERAGGASRAEG